MDEKNYRFLVGEAFKRVERTFEGIDPDLAEVEVSQGVLRVNFANKGSCILSPQPAVRQIWLAVAAKGVAFHFNYEGVSRQWIDDKGKGIELFGFLANYARETTGLSVAF